MHFITKVQIGSLTHVGVVASALALKSDSSTLNSYPVNFLQNTINYFIMFHMLNSAFHPSWVGKSSAGLWLG